MSGRNKAESWNKLDDSILAKKFWSGELDPNKVETKDIKHAFQLWSDKNYHSFAKIYCASQVQQVAARTDAIRIMTMVED